MSYDYWFKFNSIRFYHNRREHCCCQCFFWMTKKKYWQINFEFVCQNFNDIFFSIFFFIVNQMILIVQNRINLNFTHISKLQTFVIQMNILLFIYFNFNEKLKIIKLLTIQSNHFAFDISKTIVKNSNSCSFFVTKKNNVKYIKIVFLNTKFRNVFWIWMCFSIF